MKHRKIIINGKNLMGDHTGIYRYTYWILKELDKILDRESDRFEVEIVLPEMAEDLNLEVNSQTEWKKIHIKYYGKMPLNSLGLWQNLVYPKYVKASGGVALSFANSMPWFVKKGIVVIHDIMPMAHPDWYSLKHKMKFSIMENHVLKNRNISLITVSEHTASQIRQYKNGKYKDRKAIVLGNGWNHISTYQPDTGVFEKFSQIHQKEYLFSMTRNGISRNYDWLYNFAKQNPQELLVIGGMQESDCCNEERKTLNNIVFIGYITDSEEKALYENCKAYIYVSREEGFGITPLEALACNVPIILSDIPVFREIYKDTAHYVKVDDWNVDIESLLKQSVDSPEEVLKKYTWENSAQGLFSYLKNYR